MQRGGTVMGCWTETAHRASWASQKAGPEAGTGGSHRLFLAGFGACLPGMLRCLITLSSDDMQAQEGLAVTQQFNKWKGGGRVL